MGGPGRPFFPLRLLAPGSFPPPAFPRHTVLVKAARDFNRFTFRMAPKTPTQEAVEHIRFQLDLLRLCAVPALSKSVQPEMAGQHSAEALMQHSADALLKQELPQTVLLEELVKIGR